MAQRPLAALWLCNSCGHGDWRYLQLLPDAPDQEESALANFEGFSVWAPPASQLQAAQVATQLADRQLRHAAMGTSRSRAAASSSGSLSLDSLPDDLLVQVFALVPLEER